MLTHIYCGAFGEDKSIPFGPGLNIVQGYSGETAKHNGNSIGKSSFLKIVDYAFGGDYYAKSNEDIIRQIGNHDICFTHTFDHNSFFYKRNAKQPRKVYLCNNEYVPQKEVSIDYFQKELLEKSGLADRNLSLREMIGLYIRVWNKSNKDVERPLYKHNAQTVHSAITDLIKLFNLYGQISELDEQNIYLKNRRKALNAAANYHLINIPKNKSEYTKLLKALYEIDSRILYLKGNISVFNVQNSSDLNENHNALLERRGELLKAQGRCLREIRRNERSLNSVQPLNSSVFLSLTEYFPDINLQRVEEVQEFHDGLRNILKEELQVERTQLTEKLKSINSSVEENENIIKASTGLPTKVDETFALLVQAIKEREDLQGRIDLFDDKTADSNQKRETSETLTMLLKTITQELQIKINREIETLSLKIDTSNNKPPLLELSSNEYKFGVRDNTGTGKAYTDLILFDLAILALTDLPVVVHDSFLFNNIDNKTIQNILKMYNQYSEKQIFIALDNYLGTDNEDIDEILRAKTRLYLSGDKMLFGKDWRT